MRVTSVDIQSRYFGVLREITGLGEETLTLRENSRLIDLINHLTETHGTEFRLQVNHRDSYVILINGQHHEILGGEETILKTGDRVVFLPVTMGG